MVTKAELRVRSLGTWLLAVGIIAALWGLTYDINAMTQAHADVEVPVGIAAAPDPALGDGVTIRLEHDMPEGSWLRGVPPAGLSSGLSGTFTLVSWDSTRTEQALSRGDVLVGGLALLGLAILLLPVFDAIGRGTPFVRGSGRRLVASGVLVAAAGTLAPRLPALAADLVLARTGLDETRLVPASHLPLWPLLVGALLVALGVAFRRGEAIARRAEGLV